MDATSADQDENPFSPGFGVPPEHIAGRKREFALLERALQSIDKSKIEDGLLKRGSKVPIVLTGPRGVGKTLMLTWMKERAQEMKIHVARLAHVEDLPAGGAMKRLLDEVIGEADEEFLKTVKGFNASIPGFGIGLDLKDKPAEGFEKILKARLSQGPMLLLMDEAHHYQIEYMGFMLQVGQRLISQRYPLVILLAGTPDLRSCLMNIEATFMARSESIHINLLTTKESKEALSEPFAKRGIEVEPAALEMMWDMTDNYPFFVQLVGSEVWEALPEEGERRVDVALVEKVREGISDKRIDFYSLIYQEMNKGKLTSYALCVAETIMREQEAKVEREIIEHDLQQKNSDLSEEEVQEIIDRLQWLGFIWQGVKGLMEAGIPSFFTYLQAKKEQIAKKMGN